MNDKFDIIILNKSTERGDYVRDNKPCLDCEEREVGCHSRCNRYKDSLKQYDKAKYEYEGYQRDKKTRYIREGR